jgi:hypothetical protein
MAVPPNYCVLCRSDQIVVRPFGGKYVIACRTCGATLEYEPHPPDAPDLAGRIELLVEPYANRTLADLL